MSVTTVEAQQAGGTAHGSIWPAWLLFVCSVVAALISIPLAFVGNGETVLLLDAHFRLDATSRLFALLVNVIFSGIATYVVGRVYAVPQLRSGIGRFALLSMAFMLAANLSILSNHLLVSWLFLELTTLAAAPLIIREGVRSSLLASWRYLLFSSVGLGLTLLGFACIARSPDFGGEGGSLFLERMAAATANPSDLWRELGLGLVVLGYGTKLGLAPMFSWLPETYDEAPPAVTALLAAVQFNCALVGLFRVVEVFRAGDPTLVGGELVAIGLASMAVSTVGILTTRNYKRLIAYASINHGGVIAIGLGVGQTAAYGLVLYVVSNAFIKAILFLTAGKIKSHYQTKDMGQVAGLIKDLPYTGLFLMVGTFALLGLPPFGSFLGELIILSELVRAGYVLVFILFCTLLTITFVATGRSLFPMIWGEPKAKVSWPRQSALTVVHKVVFLGALVSMGLYVPPAVSTLFRQVAATLEGGGGGRGGSAQP